MNRTTISMLALALVVSVMPMRVVAQDDDEAFQDAARQARWRNSHYELDDELFISYYVIEPTTDVPPMGWPVLIALHGAGGNGLSMVQHFAPITERKGILLIAPSIGLWNYNNANAALVNIMANVQADFDVDERGVVLYGISAGAPLATLYASINGDNTLGVVAEGAPLLYSLPFQNSHTVYLMLYGENDSLINYGKQMMNEGHFEGRYPVRFEVISGAGHMLTQRGREATLDLITEVYSHEAAE